MPWSTTRTAGTNPKYRSKQHRDERAKLVERMQREGYLVCTADVCVFDTRTMTNPNGRARDGLHLGHEDDGMTYRGPQHNACNVRDGARRGNARSRGVVRRWEF
jgi:hypothetical protein